MTDVLYAGGGIGLGPRPEPPAPVPYPAPEITSRDGVTGPTKDVVSALVRLARAHGWLTLQQYAKGYVQHARTGEPGTVARGSILVRMRRGAQYATARYVEGPSAWSWDTLWIAGQHPRRFERIGEWTDAVFGPIATVAPFPWAKCPMVTTARWHPPYVCGWR